jgi:hypothetical protein
MQVADGLGQRDVAVTDAGDERADAFDPPLFDAGTQAGDEDRAAQREHQVGAGRR